MRPERLTLKQAQDIWNEMQQGIALNGKMDGKGIKLPSIDLAEIFAGRKSMTWQDIGRELATIIAAWQPPLH